MNVTDHLKKAKNTLFSIEVLPPQKGKTIDDLLKVIEPLMEFKPPFIDVTYHREEIIYKKRPDGLMEEVPLRRRPGTVGICAAIKGRFDVDTVPHLVCGGFTPEETEDALFTLHYLGINNVLLLQGDADKNKKSGPEKYGAYKYASDLVHQVAKMNKGSFLHEETENELKTNFCIGVAGYPEKHFEAPNMEVDLHYLKMKVDMGADYIVTQMFFDNEKFFAFEKACRGAGIHVPIIPGLKPIYTVSQLTMLPKVFHIDLPLALTQEIVKCKTEEAVEQVGTEWLLHQSRELKKSGVPILHYYTLGRPHIIGNVVKELV